MVEDIRNAFKELLMESRWMNRATQVISCVNNRYMYIQKITNRNLIIEAKNIPFVAFGKP